MVRTPVFNQQAPQTPLPPSDAVDAAGKTNVASGISEVAVVVERGLNQGQERTPTMMTECKTEAELESLCEAALNVMGGFSADIQAAGLIEIDSSSGSSSVRIATIARQSTSPVQCPSLLTLNTCLLDFAIMFTERAGFCTKQRKDRPPLLAKHV